MSETEFVYCFVCGGQPFVVDKHVSTCPFCGCTGALVVVPQPVNYDNLEINNENSI